MRQKSAVEVKQIFLYIKKDVKRIQVTRSLYPYRTLRWNTCHLVTMMMMLWTTSELRADLTCRLSVTSTSKDRPEYYPERQVLTPYPFYKFRGKTHMWRRYGSGWVHHIDTFTEEQDKTCQCEECIKPGTHTPKKVWGKVIIFSARHVVFDAEEARHTTCHFFYDTSATDISQCPTLTGLRVDDGGNIKGDHCEITCVTHDLDLLDKLVKLHRHRVDLRSKVWAKYGPNKNNGVRAPMMLVFAEVKPGYCVVISHPHGCSKQISVGEWTHRQTWPCTHKFVNPVQEADIVMTSYTYNSATCPGSSGAPVIRLMEETKLWWLGCHPHSEGSGDDNNSNKSVVCAEFVSPVTTYMVNLLGQLNLSSAQ